MIKNLYIVAAIAASFTFSTNNLQAHCQMPCGIYHDNMVYDQIDQYVETMYKGMTMLTSSKFNSAEQRNEFVRWIINKENGSNETAQLLNTYFLQQKIKPDEPDTIKRLVSVHKLLFLLVKVKQNVDRKIIEEFADEWEKFKLMFHTEGYECQVEMLKQRKRDEAKKQNHKPMTEEEHERMHKEGIPH